MNILLLNHYAGSLQHGMEYRPFYLAREWVKAGHQVHIVAASFAHVRSVQPTLPHGAASATQVIEGVHYHWYATPSYSGNGLGRIKNMLVFMRAVKKNAAQLVKTIQPDVVIASSTYPMDIGPAQKIAKLSKAQLVYEVHDLWPLSPKTLGNMSDWHPFIMWVQWAEDKAYKVPKTLQYMQSRGLDEKKWSHVPNGIDVSEWQGNSVLNAKHQQAIQIIAQKGLPMVGYAGAHGVANAMDTLLDTAALLKGQIEFVLVGKGPEKERLMQRVTQENLSNVHLLDSVAKIEIPAFLDRMNIAYIGWHPNPLYRFGIAPNKLMDYMMAAKPIVHSVDAGNDLVQEANCGVSVPPNQPQAAANAILQLAQLNTLQQQQLGRNGREYVMQHHTYKALADQFIKILQTK
jgi:glycosyltransferase involved in cell wall biosynthesis